MALTNFLSTVWSAQLMESLKKSLVFGQEGVVNRRYEGEIREQGSVVKINSIGAITVSDYTRDTDISAPSALTGNVATLNIDQANYFNFQVDDADAAQSNVEIMQGAMLESAYALRNKADQYIAGLYTDVDSGNVVGTAAAPIQLTAATVYEKLVDLSTILDEDDVPEINRWVAVPPWVEGLLRKDDRFVKNNVFQDAARNGQIGAVAGLRVLKSNNVVMVNNGTDDVYKIMAGYDGAITFASQINKVEGYRPEKRFADAVKGLHLYGAEVIRPKGLALIHAKK